MEEADPLTAVVAGIKQAPSYMSGSLSLDNTSLLSLAKTPINLQKLKRELMGYDPRKASEILNGFIYGLYTSLHRCPHAKGCKELKICKNKTRCSWAKNNAEIEAGRVAGPFEERPLLNLRVSPWVWFQKKEVGLFPFDSPLSYPAGDSVNDFIDPNICSVEYTRQFHNKVHTSVTNMAKIQSGYYLISLLFLKTIVPDA